MPSARPAVSRSTTGGNCRSSSQDIVSVIGPPNTRDDDLGSIISRIPDLSTLTRWKLHFEWRRARRALSRRRPAVCAGTSRSLRSMRARAVPLPPANRPRQRATRTRARVEVREFGRRARPQRARWRVSKCGCGTSRSGCGHRSRERARDGGCPFRSLAVRPARWLRSPYRVGSGIFRRRTRW